MVPSSVTGEVEKDDVEPRQPVGWKMCHGKVE
jgi:hypothetical protein